MKIALSQLEFIHPTLREIALWVEKTHGEQVVTSLYRIGDGGVHGQLPLRGLDFRDIDTEVSQSIEQAVNRRWQYDPNRPHLKCCMYHDNRWSQGRHLHLQVHPNTKKRE